MPFAPDDPRLTAYALGELDGADRTEIEALLAADPESRAYLDEVRETARLLAESLRDEPGPALEPEHHQAIESRIAPELPPVGKSRRLWVGSAIAAGLLGLSFTLVYPWFRSPHAVDRQVAMATPPSEPKEERSEDREDIGAVRLGSSTRLADLNAVQERSLREAGSRGDAAVDSFGIEPQAQAPNATALSLGSLGERQNRAYYPRRDLATADRGTTRGLVPKEAPVLAPDLAEGKPAVAPAGAVPSAVAGRTVTSFDVAAPSLQQLGGQHPVKQKLAPPVRPSSALRAGLAEVARTEGVVELLARGGRKDVESEVLAKPDVAVKTIQDIAEDRKKRVKEEAEAGGEVHQAIVDNPFLKVAENPLSTFSIDVDTASYANVRRYLNQNTRPPADAVRVEELVNYFPYSYPAPRGDEPFSVQCEVARSPWDADHRLVRIGLKGREIEKDKRPPSNLVFLIDVSGSMDQVDKLPLLKAGMKLLVEQLGENDRVAIVVYAAQEGLALGSTRADRKAEILSSLEQLEAGGSTNGGKGILLAYDLAVRNFIKGGTNRVILATDGDFNVGVTEGPELDKLIEEQRKTGVFLSVLGFGQGNVRHDKLESLADKGNGQYSFIDSIKEARKVLVEQMGGTLVTIAKDVKIQVKFDPEKTSAYRLIGYENRRLEDRDFEDDRKDAGEIGAGHCVTALYEVVPPGKGEPPEINSKVRASQLAQQAAKGNSRLLEVHLRYKAPDGEVSKLITSAADDDGRDFSAASGDFRFAASVAGFGMLLRDSPHKGSLTWDGLLELASGAVGADPGGFRREFLGLVRKAQAIGSR